MHSNETVQGFLCFHYQAPLAKRENTGDKYSMQCFLRGKYLVWYVSGKHWKRKIIIWPRVRDKAGVYSLRVRWICGAAIVSNTQPMREKQNMSEAWLESSTPLLSSYLSRQGAAGCEGNLTLPITPQRGSGASFPAIMTSILVTWEIPSPSHEPWGLRRITVVSKNGKLSTIQLYSSCFVGSGQLWGQTAFANHSQTFKCV